MHPQQRSASDDARVMTPEDELFGEFLAAVYRRIISLSPVFAPVSSYMVTENYRLRKYSRLLETTRVRHIEAATHIANDTAR